MIDLLIKRWLEHNLTRADGVVFWISPRRFVHVPTVPPPIEVVEALRQVWVPGMSESGLALELGSLMPSELCVIGELAGIWRMWPAPGDPLWRITGADRYPLLMSIS